MSTSEESFEDTILGVVSYILKEETKMRQSITTRKKPAYFFVELN